MTDERRYVYPSYYRAFACKKGDCKNSCCIGWEIDVDEETLARYEREAGDLGERLRASLSREGTPHFATHPGGRCPFLNADGLCELILSCGEALLCEICREHPRFYNALPGRVECGLGLSCEAAAELILGTRERVTLVGLDGCEGGDEILSLRDEVIALLQDREISVDARLTALFRRLGVRRPVFERRGWTDLLLSLESLDPAWMRLIERLRTCDAADARETRDADCETAYEQLLVYFVYRYIANAFDEAEALEYAAFAAFSYELMCAIGALYRTENGCFDLPTLVSVARLYSAEIEYSDENVEAILDFLRPSLSLAFEESRETNERGNKRE